MNSNSEQKKLQKEYQKYVEEKMPKSNLPLNCVKAFIGGGLICMLGQAISDFGKNYYELSKDDTAVFTAIVLVFLGATLTGLGVYDDLGKFFGAGTIVPITGFANSIVSPAMEFKREGHVLGIGAKLFIIAGPVLVFGIGSSIIVGLITCLFVR